MELTYQNKKSYAEILNLSHAKALNLNESIPLNSILFGENFDILSTLLKNDYAEKIDLIYIDPPFSTNMDFIVDETRISTISAPKKGMIAYSDKVCGDDYIEYIRERVILLRELLSEKGSFYLHIDTKIGHYLKLVLDEVFGTENFLGEITRRKSNPKNFNRKTYGNEKDVIYFYAKKKGCHIWNEVKIPLDNEELFEKFDKIDSTGRHYTTVPIHAPGESNGETGEQWHGMSPPKGRHWRTSPSTLTELDNSGLIEWSSTGNPRLKKFADEHPGKKAQDIWLNFKDPAYPTYPTQKNIEMLEFIVQQSSAQDSIVLDAFAGSGTTLLAAKKHGRKYIGIDKEPFAIEIMKERLGELTPLDQNTTFIDFSEITKKHV